jgi:hypothetical protein
MIRQIDDLQWVKCSVSCKCKIETKLPEFFKPAIPSGEVRHVKSDPLSASTPQLLLLPCWNPEHLPGPRYLEIFAYEIFPGFWDSRAVYLLHKIPSSDDGRWREKSNPKDRGTAARMDIRSSEYSSPTTLFDTEVGACIHFRISMLTLLHISHLASLAAQ